MRKIKISYIILFSIFLNNFAKSQIIYTDFTPNCYIQAPYPSSGQLVTQILKVDVNHDSINDFEFTSQRWQTFLSGSSGSELAYQTNIVPLDSTSKIAGHPPVMFGCNAISLNDSAIIDNTILWTSNAMLSFHDYSHGYFTCSLPYGPKCYPLRLHLGSNYYFGWFRVGSTTTALTLYDMAINMTPNQSILAGQTISTLVSENHNDQIIFKIFPNPNSGIFTIDYSFIIDRFNEISLYIVNGLGKVIESKLLNRNENTSKVNLTNIPNGIYHCIIENGRDYYKYNFIIVK